MVATARLHCGDTLEITKSMPDNSVDLVITSPPYVDARTYGIGFKLTGQDWVDWAVERFVDQCRICRGAVCWVVEGKTKNFRWDATPALFMADLHRRGVSLRNPPVFNRVGIPGSGGPDWFRNDKEFVVCASHGRLPWSDNTACGHDPKYPPGGPPSHRTTASSGYGAGDVRVIGAVYKPPKKSNPGNVIQETYTAEEVEALLAEHGDVTKHIVGGGVMGDRECHENEAPFPETLAEFFVLSCCPPDGVVFDGFLGSGTSAKVALVNGRNFIGCDIRESQIELTKRRLAPFVGEVVAA